MSHSKLWIGRSRTSKNEKFCEKCSNYIDLTHFKAINTICNLLFVELFGYGLVGLSYKLSLRVIKINS